MPCLALASSPCSSVVEWSAYCPKFLLSLWPPSFAHHPFVYGLLTVNKKLVACPLNVFPCVLHAIQLWSMRGQSLMVLPPFCWQLSYCTALPCLSIQWLDHVFDAMVFGLVLHHWVTTLYCQASAYSCCIACHLILRWSFLFTRVILSASAFSLGSYQAFPGLPRGPAWHLGPCDW
jgi:hypothetical protein